MSNIFERKLRLKNNFFPTRFLLKGRGIKMDNQENIPEEYQPISMLGYLGYELLFSIPVIGFIILLVFSFGGTQNKNLRNFARSYICLMVIVIVIVVILFVTLVSAGISAYNSGAASLY